MTDQKPVQAKDREEEKPAPSGVRLKSRRGPIGQTWWARTIVNLVPLHTPADTARAKLARSLATGGRVLSLDVSAGRVQADIRQGAKQVLHTGIRLALLADEIWKQAVEFMADKAHFTAKLLAGELPENIEEAFAHSRGLIPASLSEFRPFCTCGLGKTPCEHVIAVLFLLAERLDGDPFDLFLLRGRSQEDVLDALKKKRQYDNMEESKEIPGPQWNWALTERPAGSVELPSDPTLFWGQAPSAIPLQADDRPFVPLSVLQRIGLPTFTPAPRALWYDLAQAYPSREQARPDV